MKIVGGQIRNMLARGVASIVVLLLIPLISTVFAIQGVFDLFSYISIPYLMLFILICYAGQELQVRSQNVQDKREDF